MPSTARKPATQSNHHAVHSSPGVAQTGASPEPDTHTGSNPELDARTGTGSEPDTHTGTDPESDVQTVTGHPARGTE